LNAYLFSDRGIYRPGDAFHVGIILKSPVWEKNIAGVPLKVCIIDPGSRKISEKTIALSPSGFEEIAYTIQENSPTGNYEISVYIVDGEGHPKKRSAPPPSGSRNFFLTTFVFPPSSRR